MKDSTKGFKETGHCEGRFENFMRKPVSPYNYNVLVNTKMVNIYCLKIIECMKSMQFRTFQPIQNSHILNKNLSKKHGTITRSYTVIIGPIFVCSVTSLPSLQITVETGHRLCIVISLSQRRLKHGPGDGTRNHQQHYTLEILLFFGEKPQCSIQVGLAHSTQTLMTMNNAKNPHTEDYGWYIFVHAFTM